jgi:hypothetical protein
MKAARRGFRHQAVQGATASGHELKHARTFVLAIERPLDGFHLLTRSQ